MTRRRRARPAEWAAVYLMMARAGASDGEVAQEIGVCSRTLIRWRQADAALDAAIREAWRTSFEAKRVPHGTPSRYASGGCRCDACRRANTERLRERRHRRYTSGIPSHVEHGQNGTYSNWGCRCRPCATAHYAYNKPYLDAYKKRLREAAS